MIKNESARTWVNRIVAFLAGGLLIFIVLQVTIISDAAVANNQLKSQLDTMKFEPAKLLAEAKTFYGSNKYASAKETLDLLFIKHPASAEAGEGKVLYAAVDVRQTAMDKKWDAAEAGIREAWTKNMTVQLKAQFEKERAQQEADMIANLDNEWEKAKARVRADWENQI